MEYEAIPVAIYNAEEKKLIIVCRTTAIAGLLFVIKNKRDAASYIISYITQKSKMLPKTSKMPYKICFRRATAEQSRLLNGKDIIYL